MVVPGRPRISGSTAWLLFRFTPLACNTHATPRNNCSPSLGVSGRPPKLCRIIRSGAASPPSPISTKRRRLPLSRNADLSPKARDLAAQLRGSWNVDFDDAGAIGRRYRRQDEIGTPYCITVDFETLDDQAVTIRERDSMTQERIGLDAVHGWLAQRLPGC